MALALADHPFFSTLPKATLRRLATHAYRREFAPGERIFDEGGLADRLFLIRHGSVRLDAEIPGRGRLGLEVIGADAAFGWSWLLPPYRWQVSATALERTDAVVFDATTLRALMAADPVVGYELLRRLAAVMFDRLKATRRQLQADDQLQLDDAVLPIAAVSGPWAGKALAASAMR